MKLKLNFNIRTLNWKTIVLMAVIIMVVMAGVYAVRLFMGGNEGIAFQVLSEDKIPEKINEILPRYKALERALACKVDGDIYVVVTRGEKPTGGYTVDIDRIEKTDEDGKVKLVVHALFGDPKPGEVTTQVITYPYIVAKTQLKELPDKIELKVQYKD